MKTNIILATTIIGFTALAGLAYAENEGNQEEIAMSDMPAAVQKTIQDNLDGGRETTADNPNQATVTI